MEKINRRRLLWSILGLSLGLVIGYLWLREPSALLTIDRLDEARHRWQQQGPASYVLEVETKGAVGATHRIVVREGEVVEETEQIPEPEHTGEHEAQVSMEMDEKGNELWYAKDPRVPGSESIGHSAEEAVDGLEDRRKKFRDMLRKSREKKKGKN